MFSTVRRKAMAILFLAASAWAIGFPVYKALASSQIQHFQILGIQAPSFWFLSASSLVLRFSLAALVLGLWRWRELRTLNRAEFFQGLGLGLFGGLGTFFQMDALNFSSASSVAFLTQCYCLIIPIFLSLKNRRWPSPYIALSSVMVIVGVGILAGVDWTHFTLGRGELETVLASMLFAAQILWLERAPYKTNRALPASFCMFATIALVMGIVSLVTLQNVSDVTVAYGNTSAVAGILFLTVFSTILAYGLMVAWQAHISASEASLIYCSEPLTASLFSLFVPALISPLFGIDYPNELVTLHLLVGGGLIAASNVLVILKPSRL